jgi:CRP-like cAMP-binding protein
VAEQTDIVDSLAGMTLFADLSGPQLEEVAHTLDEEFFEEGARVLRRGFAGAGFYIIIEGEAAVQVDGTHIAMLSRGDFFGEISALLNELPTADVVATRALRCLVLGGEQLNGFLRTHPTVAIRMLTASARRLRNNLKWLS